MKGNGFLSLLVAGIAPILILFLITLAAGFGLLAWKPPTLWSDTFGGSGGDNSATVVASDSSGVYVQGYLNNSGLGSGPGSLFLTKYDPTDRIVWTRTIGSTNDSFIDGLSVGPDGLYLSGGYVGGITLLKYDLSGDKIWAVQFNLSGSQPGASSVSSAGLYFVGVSATQLPNESYTGAASFVRRYDLAGNLVWTREFYNGSALISGVYASSSGVYVSGVAQTPLPGQSQPGGFLLKYDSTGNEVWIRQLSGVESAIAGDSTGVYLSGSILLKYGFDGILDWAVRISSPDSSGIDDSSVSVDSSGVYLSMSTAAIHEFLMKYDPNGNQIWTFQMARPRADYTLGHAYRLSSGPQGVYVAGSTTDPSGSFPSLALIALVAPSSSLVFVGVNPPWSFVILGGLIGGAAGGLFFFLRLRRRRIRPPRIGPTSRSLPTTD